jgi:hypothetical protein
MPHHPTPSELIDAVRQFLEARVLPELSGHTAFHARVAVNALSIVLRDLDVGGPLAQAEHERLEALLGRHGSLDELRRELCAAIAHDRIALDDPDLITFLRATTLGHLSIDNPKYASYLRATSPRPPGD